MLPAVIDESQLAFLKGRWILDSVLMTNEVVEDLSKKGEKQDLSKGGLRESI